MHSSHSTAQRVVIKDKHFALATGERDSEGIQRELSNLGFTSFGMDAVGLDNKTWEQERFIEVEDMYNIRDARPFNMLQQPQTSI